MEWIGNNFSSRRNNNQIHIFHGHSTKQYFIAQNDGAHVALTILKLHADGTDVWANATFAIGGGHFFLGSFLKLQFALNRIGQTEKKRTGAYQRVCLDKFYVAAGWVF